MVKGDCDRIRRDLVAIAWGAFVGQRCKQVTVQVKGHPRKRRRFVVRIEDLAGVAVGDSVRLPNPDNESEYVVTKIEDTEILARLPLPRRTN
jgi:hypothetical protein